MDPLSAVSAVAATRPVERSRGAVDPRSGLPAAALSEAAAQIRLSATAQLLEALLTVSDPGQGATVDAQPLLPAPASAGSSAGELAQALERGLSRSGLFYEAHLAEWVRGERTELLLRSEPQGRLPALAPVASGHGQPPALDSADHAPVSLPALRDVVDPRTTGVVQQQLEALDTHVLPWQGQVWPGQALHWSVEANIDPDAAADRQLAAPHSWTSRLRLQMPQLGEIDAELRLSAAGCQLRVQAPAAQLARLRAGLPALGQALGDAGVRTERIVVSAHQEARHHD
jgi:hypothetical protein